MDPQVLQKAKDLESEIQAREKLLEEVKRERARIKQHNGEVVKVQVCSNSNWGNHIAVRKKALLYALSLEQFQLGEEAQELIDELHSL